MKSLVSRLYLSNNEEDIFFVILFKKVKSSHLTYFDISQILEKTKVIKIRQATQ